MVLGSAILVEKADFVASRAVILLLCQTTGGAASTDKVDRKAFVLYLRGETRKIDKEGYL